MSLSPGPWRWGYDYVSEDRPQDNCVQDETVLFDAEGVALAEYSDYGWPSRG